MNSEQCPECEGSGWVGEHTCPLCIGVGVIEVFRYCATCGGREGSEYAKHCCTDENMLED